MSAHQLLVLGLLLSAFGAVALVYGAGMMVLANRSYEGATESQHRREKASYLIAAVLLLIGFAIQLLSAIVR